MKSIINILSIIMLLITLVACDNDNDPTNNVCEENYVTNAITDAFVNNAGYTDNPSFEAEVQEYKIQINADGEICSVGYSNPGTTSVQYKIIIYKEGGTGYDYEGLHTFSQSSQNLDYQSITPISVSSGDIIIVRRQVQIPNPNDMSVTAGRVLFKSANSTIPYPITVGNVTFLGSLLMGENVNPALVDKGIPYIGLGFQVY